MPSSRQRSIEANPDGSVSAKRNLIFGEDLEEKENRENPLKRVVSIPEGWRIEINDARITEGLMQKKLTGEQLKKQFVEKFNGLVRQGIKECIVREKLTSVKDKNFKFRLGFDIWNWSIIINDLSRHIVIGTSLQLMIITCLNAINKISPFPEIFWTGRLHTDHIWEFFMTFVEIDKVAETFAYLSTKGRRLVKEKKI